MATERRRKNRSNRNRAERRMGRQGHHQNLAARHQLLRSAPRMVKSLGTFTGTAGGNTRIKLFNVGLITGLQFKLTVNYTVGTAVATVGPQGIYAAMSRIKLLDFDGSDRINCTGYQLYLHNTVKYGAPYGLNNQNATAVITNPNIPTAVGAQSATVLGTIPICSDFERGDLAGMLLAQTAVGELFLSIDWASLLYTNTDDRFMFNGAPTTTVGSISYSIEVWQEYLLPQAEGNGQVILPHMDLLTVYEIAGGVTYTSDLAVGVEKTINFPNVREVQMAAFTFYAGGVQGGSAAANDATRHRIIANGNNILQDFTRDSRYWEQRRMLNGDVGQAGAYLFDFRKRPLKTWIYGNVQYGITPGASVAAFCGVDQMFVSTYQKGTVLPGLGQNG